MSTNANGHVAEFHAAHAELTRRQSATLDDVVADLELAIEAEVDGRAELEAYVRESKEREAKLKKALAVLQPPPSHAERMTRPAASQGTWAPSEERITFIYEQFKRWIATESDVERSKTALTAWIKDNNEVGVSNETVSKCMDALRERELVRVTGTIRGGGKTWALMPEPEAAPNAA